MNGKRKYFGSNTSTVTFTAANRDAGTNLLDLTSLMETISTGFDGTKIIIKNITVAIQGLKNDTSNNRMQMIVPLIVQTAGTFTSTVDIDKHTLSETLDQCIDDEFGFQCITEPKASRLVNVTDDGGLEYHRIWSSGFKVPRNIVNLLNKEVNTERLQSLILGIYTRNGNSATSAVTFDIMYCVEYTISSKGITIR